jgi:hypothetical protein
MPKIREIRRSLVIAWREFASAERRTAWHLLVRGFLYRREPAFVGGQKPDFLTFGRGRMWIEVKEFDPPVSQALLDNAWEELTERLAKFTGKCRIDAWIAPGFDPRVAKQVTHLLSQEIRAGLPTDRELYIAVPSGAIDNTVVRLNWKRRDGTDVQLVACRSIDGIYGCPPAADPNDWTADLKIIEANTALQRPAFTVLKVQRPARVLLRVEARSEERVLCSLSNAEFQDVKTVDRLRDVIGDANDQIKNGQKHRALPGVLVVYFDQVGAGDHGDILRACLGDLTVSIDRNANAISKTFYGLNGVFRSHKNTAISAIIYRSRHYSDVSLINSHALHPVDRGWMAGTVYWVDSSGAVRSG